MKEDFMSDWLKKRFGVTDFLGETKRIKDFTKEWVEDNKSVKALKLDLGRIDDQAVIDEKIELLKEMDKLEALIIFKQDFGRIEIRLEGLDNIKELSLKLDAQRITVKNLRNLEAFNFSGETYELRLIGLSDLKTLMITGSNTLIIEELFLDGISSLEELFINYVKLKRIGLLRLNSDLCPELRVLEMILSYSNIELEIKSLTKLRDLKIEADNSNIKLLVKDLEGLKRVATNMPGLLDNREMPNLRVLSFSGSKMRLESFNELRSLEITGYLQKAVISRQPRLEEFKMHGLKINSIILRAED